MAVDIRANSNNIKTITSKQDTLVSGTNIKTINGTSILGVGNIVIASGSTSDGTTLCTTGSVMSILPACVTAWNGKQASLVSGTSIKSINGASILAAGDLSLQATLVSGTSIKTINGTSLLGSGDIAISGSGGTTDGTTLCTTTNTYSILPACNTKWNGKQDALVSGTSIKTINGTSILGSGDIVISGGGGSATPDGTTISTNASSQLCIVCACKQKWDNTVPNSTYTTVDCSVGAFIDTSTLDKTVNLVFSANSNNNTTTSVYSRACISTMALSCGGLSCSVIAQTSVSVNYGYLQSRATGGSYSASLTLHGCCAGTGTIANLYSAHTTCVYGETLTQIGNCVAGCTYIAGRCLLLCGLPTTDPARMCQLWVCNGYVVSGTPGSIGGYIETLGTAKASAANLGLTASTGASLHITGTTTITSLGTTGTTGQTVKLIFDGALVLTHNATSLINITGANITTAAGDTAVFLNENGASGYWRMLSYNRKSGQALVSSVGTNLANTISTCVNALSLNNSANVITQNNYMTSTSVSTNINICNLRCASGTTTYICESTYNGNTNATMRCYELSNVLEFSSSRDLCGTNLARCVSTYTSSSGCTTYSVSTTAATCSTISFQAAATPYGSATLTLEAGGTNAIAYASLASYGSSRNATTCISAIASDLFAAYNATVLLTAAPARGSGALSIIKLQALNSACVASSPVITLVGGDSAQVALCITGLPTTNPGISGRVWNNNGVLSIVP